LIVLTVKRVTQKDGQQFDHNPYGIMQEDAFAPRALVRQLDPIGTAQ